MPDRRRVHHRPAAHALAGSAWSFNGAVQYVLGNAGLYITQHGIAGGPTGVPFPGYWNGSLWTLFYEFCAYIATAALFSLPLARRRPSIFAAVVLCLTIVGQLAAPMLPASVSTNLYRNMVTNALWLGAFYAAGALLATVRNRVPASTPLALGAAAVLVVSVLTSTITTLGALPLAYLALWLGAVMRIRVGSRNDISYGVYIYAFPVQQALAAFGLHLAVPFWVFAFVALVITSGLAWASWRLVEQSSLWVARILTKAPTPPDCGRRGLVRRGSDV